MYEFDWFFYTNFYDDLNQINSEEKAIKHFLEYGRKEERIFCEMDKNFDWIYYLFYNKDLLNYFLENIKSKYDFWKHFLYYGYFDNRKYCRASAVDLLMPSTRLKNIRYDLKIQFDGKFYKEYHNDLKNLNDEQLFRHFLEHGKKENRIFCPMLKEFNYLYYIVKYPDIIFDDIFEIWKHYIYHGFYEKREINTNLIIKYDVLNLNENEKLLHFNTLPNSYKQILLQNLNTAVIYVYYSRPNEYKNESNLAFFIRQTILKENSKKILYLFIINNYLTEVEIPKQDNILILKNQNCFDFEAYGTGIIYLKNKLGKEFWNIKRMVLMNCSVTGPFYNYQNNHWLNKFEDRLIEENSVACSSVLYKLALNDPDSRGIPNIFRLPGYFLYFKVTEHILNILNIVLRKHNSKLDCILQGEYGFSRELLKNNYRISCLTHRPHEHNYIPVRIDRDYNLNNYNIYSLVFVKINWRALWPPNRDSVPIKYIEVENEINKICNFKFDNYQINYNKIECPNEGLCDYNRSYNWRNKEMFYKTFGKAEEFITFPIVSKSKNIALYAHHDKDNIFRDYCQKAVITLSLLGYYVIILTTCATFKNCSSFFSNYEIITYLDSKVDFYMHNKYINNNLEKIKKYENILLLNDSILFPIHGLNNMNKTIENTRKNCDYWGIWNSNENKYHIMSPFLEFKMIMIDDLKKFMNECNIIKYEDGINFEINLVSHMNKLNYKHNVVIDYNTLGNLNYTCPIMHPNVFINWINRPESFAIKWKYMCNYLNLEKLNIPYMNYLLRFIHFNHTGIKGQPEIQGVWESPLKYLK